MEKKKRIADFFIENDKKKIKHDHDYYNNKSSLPRKLFTREYNIFNLINSLNENINSKFEKVEKILIKQNEKINRIENKIINLEEFINISHESIKKEFLYLEELMPNCDKEKKNNSFFDLVIS